MISKRKRRENFEGTKGHMVWQVTDRSDGLGGLTLQVKMNADTILLQICLFTLGRLIG